MTLPDGASMRDCIFRAHDDRFFDIVGDSPEIVRLAKKEHDFAHEVSGACPCSCIFPSAPLRFCVCR